MSWSVAFRLRRQVRESLWIVPFIGGALGWLLGLASADFGACRPERPLAVLGKHC